MGKVDPHNSGQPHLEEEAKVALQEAAMEEMIPVVSGQPEEAMVVEQEEMMEEDDITHQPSQEEEIPREPGQDAGAGVAREGEAQASWCQEEEGISAAAISK